MPRLAVILLLAGLFSDAAFAFNASAMVINAVTVRLDAQNDSGQTGTATLLPEGDGTKVVIELSNVPEGVAQPTHIHLGQCDNLDKAPKWPLEAVKDGQSTTVIPVSLDAILQDRTAINVHKSVAEVQIYVACGNIAPMM